MAKRSPDKGKKPADLETRMKASIQRMSDNFNQQIRSIQQQLENVHSSKMDHLLATFQQLELRWQKPVCKVE